MTVAASVAGLTATADIRSVSLAWTEDDPHANRGGLSYEAIDKVEVWASQTNDRDGTASKVAEGRKTAVHATSGERQTWYYWIKPRLADPTAATYGDWYPSGNTAGISTRTKAASDATYALQNGTLVVSRPGGNTLKVEVKTLAGADPSADDPVTTHFPNFTGSYDLEPITAALSFTFSNGSTAGFVSGDPSRLWFLAFRASAGSVVLGAVKCSLSNQLVLSLPPSAPVLFTNAEGGAGGADTVGAVYTAAALSGVPYTIVGYADWDSGPTAPTVSDPDRVVDYKVGMPTPGSEAFPLPITTFGNGTTTLTIPFDGTIPQSGEGALYSSISSLAAPCDLVRIKGLINFSYSVASKIIAPFFIGSGADAAGACWCDAAADRPTQLKLDFLRRAGGTFGSAFAISVRIGGASAGTFRLNTDSAGNNLGGVMSSFIEFVTVTG